MSETDQPQGDDADKIQRSSLDTSQHEAEPDQDPSQLGRRFSLSGAGNLSLDDVAAVEVKIRDIRVEVNTAPSWFDPITYPELMTSKFNTKPRIKKLLYGVDADLRPGTLTAIIGGSGSGKTTLLNTMAERVFSNRMTHHGTTTFNGETGVSGVRSAYVMQQDILLPTLTVRETLQYAAALRLPTSITEEQRSRVVEEVILELGLKACADTRIGNHSHRGCSGGEKRRVSIGVQLLANPSVLFLDEPTTGLDATSAYQIVRTLKMLAQKGRTVITTIHQPRSEIWDLFDNLIVLTKGSPVYSGPVKDCLPWFEQQGFQLPPLVNPAEFIIDIAAIDNRTPELEETTTARVERLKSAWESEGRANLDTLEKNGQPAQSKPLAQKQRSAGYARQTVVLTSRAFKVTYRDPMGMLAAIAEAILMSVIVGYMFYDIPRDLSGIRSRQGGVYTVAGLQGYLVLLFETYRMVLDIPTFDRESSEGCVNAIPFVLSRRLARMFTEDIPVPLLFSCIFYWMTNLERDVTHFFIFFGITLLVQYIAVTCAMTCVTASRHFTGASLIANLAFTLQSLACGIFIQSETIPVYVRWLKWITYTFYAFGAYAGNEFEDNFYDCPVSGGPSNPACKQYTGTFIMDQLGFPNDWVARPIGVLLGFVFFFLFLSCFGLHFIKKEITIARAKVSDTDLSAGKEKMAARSISEVRAIDVSLENFALDLKVPCKPVLDPVNTTFQAGVLNVIMGPSGSGKTSLLDTMALRLRGGNYKATGKLKFNGAVPSNSVIRSVCSYVCQDDDALLPSLTVRETLRFAAGLRLPSFMSKEEKNQRAEEVLLKMGLKDCANNLIGNELVKGISGGEKRRVTIAVQVLTDPRIMMLDEPTSGLDAFTASSIMDVLHGLAQEGRTLILTIHQARSDLFKHFGNVLLLARGGAAVYAGAASGMLSHFSALGYECPRHTNPADFALDMITIDLQQEQREKESRERVEKLTEHWKHHGQAVKPISVEKTGDREATSSEEAEADGHAPLKQQHSLASNTPRPTLQKESLSTPAELGALIRKRASFATALPILLQRTMINCRRQPDQILARTMQVVGLAIIFTLFFAPVKKDFFSVQNRMGFVQEIGAFYFVGMLQNVAIYPVERDVFYREDDDGVYGVDAFIISYTLTEVPFEIISCLIFGVLAIFAVDLPRTVELFFVTVFACFGVVSCGESLGIMFNTLVGHTGFAVNLMGILLSVANVMAGILSIDMPELFKAFNYLSPIRYATRAVAPYSLEGVDFTCTDAQRLPNGNCPIETGQDVLDLYKFNTNPVVNVGALAGCVVVYRVLAWLLLRIVRGKWRKDGMGLRKWKQQRKEKKAGSQSIAAAGSSPA